MALPSRSENNVRPGGEERLGDGWRGLTVGGGLRLEKVGGWWGAGGWRGLAVGGGWRLEKVGGWWGAGGWRGLAVGGGRWLEGAWRLEGVGGGWWLGGGWRLEGVGGWRCTGGGWWLERLPSAGSAVDGGTVGAKNKRCRVACSPTQRAPSSATPPPQRHGMRTAATGHGPRVEQHTSTGPSGTPRECTASGAGSRALCRQASRSARPPQ